MTAQINSHKVEIIESKTILQVARELGISIPTLCHKDGLPHQTSCMVCVVQEINSGKLWPACATVLEEGMVIETHNEFVRQARKDALTLLMSEHIGDCEGPCKLACPAQMDIPQMLRHIQNEDWHAAIQVIKTHIPLPATLGRICPAPCEKICRLGKIAESVSICEMKRVAADKDLEASKPYLPEMAKVNGKSIGIIGAGPCGLSAAFYLKIFGYNIQIYDQKEIAGGLLRVNELAEKLPKAVLDQEIDILKQMGIVFSLNHVIDKNSFFNLQSNHDAILIATGKISRHGDFDLPVPLEKEKIVVNPQTFQIEDSKLFAAGGGIRPMKMAVMAVAHGHFAAESMHQFLSGEKVSGLYHSFNSRLKHIDHEDIVALQAAFQKQNDQKRMQDPIKEAGRCLHCDCLSKADCQLRDLSTEYHVLNSEVHTSERLSLQIDSGHSKIIFESGKCIRCGICVELAKENLSPELTFIHRGDAVKVTVPFHDTMIELSDDLAVRVAEACPTGAFTSKG